LPIPSGRGKKNIVAEVIPLGEMPVKTIPLPTPFPVGDVNCYLIAADPVTVVDPGLLYQPSEDALSRALGENGLRLDDIKRVVITHGHPDHYGLAGKIQKCAGAEVLVRDEEMKKIKPDQEYLEGMVKSLKTMGLPDEAMQFSFRAGGEMPFTHALDRVVTYSGEQRLEFSGFGFSLLHTPGHSGGHTCLYCKEESLLLSGDLLLPGTTAIPTVEYDPGRLNLRSRSLSGIMGSIERVIDLKPSICLPGHGEAIPDPAELGRSRVDFHLKRLEEIYRLVPQGEENGITPYGLSRVYFPSVRGFDRFLAVIEVVAHLDWLADQGRIVEVMDQKGVSRFHRRVQ